jgi:TP901 family phage tail tape measure protein
VGEEVADLFITLRSITDPFSKGLKGAAADAESQSKRMGTALASVAKVGLGIGAAMVGIGVESVSMASKFNAQMTLLQTQAGVSKGQMAGLTSGVLSLAGQVGFSPTSLAQALFHVESSFASVGISGPKALDLLKIAAEGAAVGHADLVDVTNALDSAVVSGIPGVQDMSQAMGVLNATVGAGDMTMQDLANAFSTGLLATVKGYGLTFKDVGAGLAVFGDNNIRGAVAATDLRMAVQAMAVPAKSAGAELEKLGLSSTTLAKDMQDGGMLQALEDLKKHMLAAGVTTKEQGQVITELFGKKAGTGLNVLIDQLDRVKSKYPDLTKGATGFADAWTATKATFAQQMKEIAAEADALGVRLGNFLLPHVSGFISAAQSDLGQAVSGFSGAASKPVAHANLHNATLNQEVAAPPPLIGWEKFGQETHRVLTELEQDVVKLKPVGQDFVRFGEEAWQALQKLVVAAQPVAKVFGGALLVGITAAGKILADVVGPAFKDFADFLSSHQGEVKFFAEVILGALVTKMTVLSTIKATQGIVGLATSIAQFPLSQTGQIKTAFDGLKTAWAGKEAAQGEKAVTGLKGALTDLKGAASGVLDKFPLFDSGKLAGLARAGEDIKKVETAAADSEQLGLFETNLKGIVQVADTQQLALFETDIAGVGAKAETSAVSAEKLSGKLGKFALAGGMAAALVGVGLLADQLGKLMGVGDHTALSMDKLNTQLSLAGAGSSASRAQFTQTAVSMVAMDSAMSHFGQHAQGLKDVDTSLTQLVTSGHAQEAKAQFDDIAAALAKQGVSAQDAAAKFPQFEQALKDAGNAADTMDGKVQAALTTLQKQQALDQFQSDLSGLSEQLKSTGNALTGNSQNAISNRQAFAGAAQEALDFYQQQRNAGVPMAQATADLQKQYTALESVATAALGSKSAADAFLKTLGLIKPEYSTTLKVHVNTSELTGFYAQMDSVSKSGGHAIPGLATGGFVSGSKGAPQLAIVHGGEYMLSNEMQEGRQPIDPRVLGGMSGGAGRSVGGVMGGTTVVNNYYVTNIAGSVVAEKQLTDKVRTQVLQYDARNSGNGLSTRSTR